MRAHELAMTEAPNPLATAKEDVGLGSPIGFARLADDAQRCRSLRGGADEANFWPPRKRAARRSCSSCRSARSASSRFGPTAATPKVSALPTSSLVNMDEYLTPDGKRFIAKTDTLSFRAHMDRGFYGRLDAEFRPPESARHFPDPLKPEATGALIDALGGVDVCFGGVGITGHLAFNDPPEPGETVERGGFRRAADARRAAFARDAARSTRSPRRKAISTASRNSPSQSA